MYTLLKKKRIIFNEAILSAYIKTTILKPYTITEDNKMIKKNAKSHKITYQVGTLNKLYPMRTKRFYCFIRAKEKFRRFQQLQRVRDSISSRTAFVLDPKTQLCLNKDQKFTFIYIYICLYFATRRTDRVAPFRFSKLTFCVEI